MKMELMAPKIDNICFALPKNIRTYDEDMAHLGPVRLKAAKRAVGVNKRHVSDENTFASDLAIRALKEALNISGKKIDALIVASCTPDYRAPKLSSMISHGAKLGSNVLCIDYFGYCNSFLTTLAQAAMMIEHCSCVAIVCVDTQSKTNDPSDKQNMAITSDNASAVIVEQSGEIMYFTEEAYFDEVMNMSNLVSACRKGDELAITNNELVFKIFFEHFPKLYKDFIKHTPKSEINFTHSPIKFFQDRVQKECGINFFNESLMHFGCLYSSDIQMNLLLANNKINFEGKRCLLLSHGSGTIINIANLPIWNFKSKIVYI